ncbi:MAG: mandelate racemase/muconate lactonizing enzyme family protein [Chloroflexi bacterium]|jgi:L-alanine-DL-glutamate epimerase-like enolase superfamily enzyme|uniref:Enolase n=1 Tax=Candidatus Thermofonsia Clade 3 bacterium TaxID=2364212 RepID=A0A2M8QCH7_9CHLR|nr:mandelate racemase/muconate lactonizing enzyme family protein [Candidatus Roseilinea sp. NK_OTU-006]PJF47515.1 MAG: enolase [Candidatus Thermofonsia Clade 3 bacterium]RMG63894.1 MAG: mandelate racemase/muconate lactonizing enzyme family protein [Chloroflexota bacterium]
MHITDVTAVWLHCPIPPEQQHLSDFGRIASFDAVLVTVTTSTGLVGYGEAKAGVGSAAVCASLVTCVREELRPLLIGQDPRQINRLWERMYNGVRDHYALTRGRAFPILGRRGLTIAAMSGVDMALWDLGGKLLECPVVQLLGGTCRDAMPAYASGGWADVDGIGQQLLGYVNQGFRAVKMRVGVMDGDVDTSVARVRAARQALGPKIKLMADAHGTYSVPEAKRFCDGVADCDLFWFEEPVNADDRDGAAEVRAHAQMPIAAGESEFTRFDFRDLIQRRAVDVLQPDLAICGGITEGRRIAALAEAHQLALAPHLWGSALSFAAGLHLAFASPSAIILEYSLGANPLLRELPEEQIEVHDGMIAAPVRPGLGVTPRQAFVERYAVKA